MASGGQWSRRSVLRGAAVAFGAAAVAPMLGGAATAVAGTSTGGGDADALFKAGKFEEAGRAYEEILKTDPTNLNAARQRGYVGLLGNQFADAERYLTMARTLAPTDQQTNALLGDCYIRQDKFALSVPCWKAAGYDDYATWFAAFRGEPYQIVGDTGQVPWLQLDPMPQLEASINGGAPMRFTFYTGASNLSLTGSVAKQAGLSPVYSEQTDFEGATIWVYYGILDSFRLGDLELRNVPVGWSTTESGADVDPNNDGLIGTWIFYHLLTTFDYAGRSLTVRRPTPGAAAKARSDAARAGIEPLPLWLALDHYVHSIGSIAGSGPRVLGMNFGGSGDMVAGMPGPMAKQLGVRTDYDRPIETFGHSHAATTYPCYPNELRMGAAFAGDVYCETDPNAMVNVPWPYGTGFDTTGWLAHCFWKPYTITLDFTGMNAYIGRGKAA